MILNHFEKDSRMPLQGVKLRKIIWFPFGNPPLEIGFPNLLQDFRMDVENLSVTKL